MWRMCSVRTSVCRTLWCSSTHTQAYYIELISSETLCFQECVSVILLSSVDSRKWTKLSCCFIVKESITSVETQSVSPSVTCCMIVACMCSIDQLCMFAFLFMPFGSGRDTIMLKHLFLCIFKGCRSVSSSHFFPHPVGKNPVSLTLLCVYLNQSFHTSSIGTSVFLFCFLAVWFLTVSVWNKLKCHM